MLDRHEKRDEVGIHHTRDRCGLAQHRRVVHCAARSDVRSSREDQRGAYFWMAEGLGNAALSAGNDLDIWLPRQRS